jgi:hypothetical protein
MPLLHTLKNVDIPVILKQGVCQLHCGRAIFTFKKYLKKAKEELWKLKYFTIANIYNLQNNPLKETKILQDIITL